MSAPFLRSSPWILLAFCLADASSRQALGQADASPPGSGHPDASLSALTNSPVRMLSTGMVQVGQIIVDKEAREARLPATVDKTNGLMEYLLVASYGKTHESVLKTDAEPSHIHLAMLLLGARGAPSDSTNTNPAAPGPIVNPSPVALPGDRIKVVVEWMSEGKSTRRPAGDLVVNNRTHSTADETHWVYNGSEIADGKFYAQLDGSIISLVTDPVALANYTGAGHDNDQIWEPNTNTLPPRGAPVVVILQLQANSPPPTPAPSAPTHAPPPAP